MPNIDYTKLSIKELEELERLAMEADEDIPEEKEFLSPETKENLKEYVARPVLRTGKAIASALGTVADIPSIPFQAMGAKIPSHREFLERKIDELTNGLTKPRNELEEYVDEAAAAAAALPMGGPAAKVAGNLGALQKAGKTAQTLVSAVKPTPSLMAGTAAGSATSKYLRENPEALEEIESPTLKEAAKLGATIGANVGTQLLPKVPKGIKHVGKKSMESIAGKMGELGELDPYAVEEARKAGIEMTPADVLKSEQAKRQQNILGKIPFVGGKIRKAKERQYETALEALSQHEPEKLTKEAGAELVKKGVDEKIKQVEKLVGEQYTNIEKQVKSYGKHGEHKDLVAPKHSLKFLEGLRSRLKSSEAKADFDNSDAGKLLYKFKEYGKNNKDNRIAYNDLMSLRERVQDMNTTFGIHGGVTKGNLKQLYGRINQDVGDYLKDINPTLYKEWKDVNKYYSSYKDKTLPALNKVLSLTKEGKDIDALMSVMPTKRGGKALEDVLKALPTKEEKKELFDIIINTVGTDNKGNFSLVKTYNYFKTLPLMTQNKLLHAAGKSGEDIKKFRATLTTINNIWKKSAQENFSESGSHLIQHGTSLSILSALAQGNYLMAAKKIGGLALATMGTGALIKDQKLINMMYTAYQKKSMTKDQFDNWTKSIGKRDPVIKNIVNKSLNKALITSTSTIPDGERGENIDYSQYSEKELEELIRLAEE